MHKERALKKTIRDAGSREFDRCKYYRKMSYESEESNDYLCALIWFLEKLFSVNHYDNYEE